VFDIVSVGADGTKGGAAVTELLVPLVHPFDDWVTVYEPDVTVLGFPLPPSLQIKVPVIPLAVITELPQLFVIDSEGISGVVLGAAVTALLEPLTQPFIVCVTL
jgi:hypothetical protein